MGLNLTVTLYRNIKDRQGIWKPASSNQSFQYFDTKTCHDPLLALRCCSLLCKYRHKTALITDCPEPLFAPVKCDIDFECVCKMYYFQYLLNVRITNRVAWNRRLIDQNISQLYKQHCEQLKCPIVRTPYS